MADADLTTHEWKLRYSREAGDPLTDFYIPALQRSVQYDRKAGFFSSTALSAAARGIAGLILNDGHMRLLVSAHLSRQDVRAINEGYDLRQRIQEKALEQWEYPAERIERERLQALAWMIARGTLEIRIAVPVNEDGTLQDVAADELFHEKVGIFTDAHGNRVAFTGSNNESLRGWLRNRESFNAFWSWRPGDDARIEAELEEFEELWEDRARFTRVIDFPDAVRQRFIEIAPEEPPERDPEDPEILEERERRLERERWLFQFVRDAPYMPNGDLLAEEFATVDLWPHQKKVADQIVETYPEPYLLCDEVGLGKTVEAGIALKRLLLPERVKRCLILVPASLVTQWQEELIEKFNLNTWQYTGSGFVDAHGNETPQNPDNPWNTHEVIIASSHLAKRQERTPTLLEADEWDLVVVDEAHHARRRQPTGEEYRPNRLLHLLQQIRDRTRGMLLLTATPMQLDPIEVWDLMEAMGLGGEWGALGGELFTRYFEELRHFPDRADLPFLCEMLHDYLDHVGTWDEAAEALARDELGLIKLQDLKNMGESGQCDTTMLRWSDEELAAAAQFFRAHTPLHHYVFRHTRDLLRSYRRQGLLDKNIPDRDPHDEFIEFATREERELYDRIEKYIRDVYVAADEQNRTGVGFVMTIYRQRLTSSFYAIERSLQRRLAHLRGEDDETTGGLVAEDYEDEDLSRDVSQEIEDQEEPLAINVAEEIQFIEKFLRDIGRCGKDSKLDRFTRDLEEAFRTHRTVVVFTHYTDTMDYIRDKLVTVYGRQVACYSGRGGERWDGEQWQTVSKEHIKNLFAEGEDVKILLCTEAASEGLNLQTCSMLINYDMPWNPMKVEQRIGRIDRIGQE
ncbi:MAG: SNF2-related protein, partial [Armatimonadota bacterium]